MNEPNEQDSKYETLIRLLETHKWDYTLSREISIWQNGAKERAAIEQMVSDIGTQEAICIFQAYRAGHGY